MSFNAANACGAWDTIAARNDYAKAFVTVGVLSVDYLAAM
jgi:hypothetical protein